MKLKFTLFQFLILFCATLYAQSERCGRPNPEFCTGNYFQNGNFETVTGDPEAVLDNDIDLATGWFRIWGGFNSLADIYCNNSTALASHSVLINPTNPDGIFSGMWIQNSDNTSPAFREGMYNQLSTPVPSNSGIYTFNFDAADLTRSSNGDMDVVVGIFGVYNPGNILSNPPTQMFIPTDFNLWPTGNGVVVYKLGSVTIPQNVVNTFQPFSLTFDSNLINASPDITHIMITRDDVPIPGPYRRRYIGFDNFCMRFEEPSTSTTGAYCCEKNENLLANANFESGNTGFNSDYDQNSATLPGQYHVTNSAANFGATINDHSYCVDSDLYSANENYLLVNGLTNQPAGSSSVIYSQTLGLTKGKEYNFCVNLKNMPQCTFDILPEIQIEINGTIVVPYTQINTDPSDPCDWMLISGCFTATGQKNKISIRLKEDGLGDGNDIAIDDISLQEKQDPDYNLTVTHNGGNNTISATIDPYPFLNESCEMESDYAWFVYETTNPTGPLFGSMVPGTFAWSDDSGSYGAVTSGASWGVPSTNFATYNGFQNNKFYVIGMYIPSCCESCFSDGWAYQITYNYQRKTDLNFELTYEMKEEIKALLIKTRSSDVAETIADKLQVYPNPSTGIFEIKTEKSNSGQLKVYSVNGELVYQDEFNQKNQLQINLINQPKGVYVLKIQTEDGAVQSKKLVLK